MRSLVWPLGIVLLWGAVAAGAEERPVRPSAPAKVEKPKKPGKPAARVGPQEEAAAREFARAHHPELLPILDHLEKNRPNEYRHAVAELNKTAARLAQLKAKEAARYELELKAWKLRSRVQLMAARLRLDPDDEALRGSLRRAMLEQADLEIATCEAERARQARRLEQLDEQIRRLRAQRESRVDRKIEVLTRAKKRPHEE